MGWADCGKDSNGRPIGYAFEATCDYPGCDKQIDRGLAYACGPMHGENGYDCEKYFCEEHLHSVETIDGECEGICAECLKLAEENGVLKED